MTVMSNNENRKFWSQSQEENAKRAKKQQQEEAQVRFSREDRLLLPEETIYGKDKKKGDTASEMDSEDDVVDDDDKNWQFWTLNIQYLIGGSILFTQRWNFMKTCLPNLFTSWNLFYPTHFSSVPTPL